MLFLEAVVNPKMNTYFITKRLNCVYLETVSLGSILVRSFLVSLGSVYTIACFKVLFSSSWNIRFLFSAVRIQSFSHPLLLPTFLIPVLLGILRDCMHMSLIRLCWLVMFPFPGSFQLDGFAFVLFFCSAFCSSKQLQMLCSLFLVLGEGKAVSESCSTKAECRRLLPRRCFYCANTVVSFISLMLQIPM